MGRGRSGGYHGTYCDCKGCKNRRAKAEQKENQRREDEHNSHSNLGLFGNAALGVTSAVGLATNPTQQPDTNSLSDTYQTQVERYGDSVEEASHKQGQDSSQQ